MSDLVDTVMDAMEGVEVWVGWGDGVADDDGSYGTLDRDSKRPSRSTPSPRTPTTWAAPMSEHPNHIRQTGDELGLFELDGGVA